jgi:hypothetical protein
MLQIGIDGRRPVWVRRPSMETYEKLVRERAGCQHLLETQQGDRLAITGYALASVIEFLHADRAVMDSGITNPLAVILNALHDRRYCGKPALFFDRPVSGGRPTDQTFDAVKAAAAMGVEVLRPFRITRSVAGKFVAEQAHGLGFRQPNGRAITGKTVLGWRDEIETAKSEIGAEVFRRLQARRAAAAPLADQKQAKALARQYLVEARLGGHLAIDV